MVPFKAAWPFKVASVQLVPASVSVPPVDAFATTAATVAVAAVGYLALTSRIPWSWAFSVIVGVALIFGAAQIVQSLTNGQGG